MGTSAHLPLLTQNYLVSLRARLAERKTSASFCDAEVQPDAGYIYGEYTTDVIRIRILPDRWQFCLRKNFDRWANSVEFIFFGHPQIEDIDDLIHEAECLCRTYNRHNEGYGKEQDIASFLHLKVRKQRL